MESKCLGKLLGLFYLPIIFNGALGPSAKTVSTAVSLSLTRL